MRKRLFLILAFAGVGMCCNAQQNLIGYDTIPIAEEHFDSGFSLYAIIPKLLFGIHLEQLIDSCKVYVQVDAHMDIDKEGALRYPQHNSSEITILAIKDIETGKYLYSKENEADDSMISMVEVLTCYFQNKFSNVFYYLSGHYTIPPEIIYYYVEKIK